MHRLIPSQFSEPRAMLDEVVEDEAMAADAARLDAATDEQMHGGLLGLSGIGNYELVYGIPNAQIIRAAFLHPGPFGSRFNDMTRGAWYAAKKIETAIAEVAYHKAKRLSEIVVPGLPGERPGEDASTYDDWQADFRASFHVLEPAKEFAEALQPEPVPQCYRSSQELARQLLAARSNGILYPSVRDRGGSCLVCFRPALVQRPRRAKRYRICQRSTPEGYATTVQVERP